MVTQYTIVTTHPDGKRDFDVFNKLGLAMARFARVSEARERIGCSCVLLRRTWTDENGNGYRCVKLA